MSQNPAPGPGRWLLLAGSIAVLSACAGPRVDPGRLAGDAPAAQLGARVDGAHVFLPVTVDGRGPVLLMLDSGATFTSLNHQVAAVLRVDTLRPVTVVGIGPERLESTYSRAPVAVGLPGALPFKVFVPVADYSGLNPFLGEVFAGFLGGDLFWRYVVEIDYEAERVVLHDPRRFRPPPDAAAIPLVLERNLPYAEAVIELPDGGELAGRFLVDSGSGVGLIVGTHRVWADSLAESFPAAIPSATAGLGGEALGLDVRAKALRLGPFRLEAPTLMLAATELGQLARQDREGLIGGEVLRRFTVVFDYRGGMLYLSPNAAFGERFLGDKSGLSLVAAGEAFEQLRVHRAFAGSPAAEAGIRRGDRVLAVNGAAVDSIGFRAVREALRGPDGAELVLTLDRDGQVLERRLVLEGRI